MSTAEQRIRDLAQWFQSLGANAVTAQLLKPERDKKRGTKPRSPNRWLTRGDVRNLCTPDGLVLADVSPWSGIWRFRDGSGALLGLRLKRGEAMRDARRVEHE